MSMSLMEAYVFEMHAHQTNYRTVLPVANLIHAGTCSLQLTYCTGVYTTSTYNSFIPVI